MLLARSEHSVSGTAGVLHISDTKPGIQQRTLPPSSFMSVLNTSGRRLWCMLRNCGDINYASSDVTSSCMSVKTELNTVRLLLR